MMNSNYDNELKPVNCSCGCGYELEGKQANKKYNAKCKKRREAEQARKYAAERLLKKG